MKKSSIILIVFNVILIIALIVMTLLYFNMREYAKINFDSAISNAEMLYETNIKIKELEEELKKYKSVDITTTVNNSTNTNNINTTQPYIPDGMDVASQNKNSDIKVSDLELNRSPENVTIEVLENTITNNSVEILITDDNKDYYGWGVDFKVQKKVNNKWEDLKYISDDIAWISIAYVPNEKNQIKQKLDIEKYYGKLGKGTYRITKSVYDKEYIDLYSNEFEIK